MESQYKQGKIGKHSSPFYFHPAPPLAAPSLRPPSFVVPLTHPHVPPLCSLFLLLVSFPQGIGRMILKEEMKARSGCHDNEQWGSRRSSRCSSKEALNHLGFSSLNGCKSEAEGGFLWLCFMYDVTVM